MLPSPNALIHRNKGIRGEIMGRLNIENDIRYAIQWLNLEGVTLNVKKCPKGHFFKFSLGSHLPACAPDLSLNTIGIG